MEFEIQEYILNGYKIEGFLPQITLLRRGIYLDTGPLYLLIVGHHNKVKGNNLLKGFQYSELDYKYLLAFLNSIKLHDYSLLVTPQIFTEFIQHLWKASYSEAQFREILETSFKTKWFLKDTNVNIKSFNFFSEKSHMDKKIEIGDTSICICIKEGRKEKRNPITILTSDSTFAGIARTKYDFLPINYSDIRSSTLMLKEKNIPLELLKEPLPN